MTTTKYPKIHRLISDRRFNEAKLLFEKSNLTGSGLISIYKKQNKERPRLFDQPEFWQSELPLLCLNELMKSEIKSDFLHKYFSKNENVNDQLNIELFSDFKEDSLRYYKLNRSFLFSEFRESVKMISKNLQSLIPLSYESQLVYEELEQISKEETEMDHLIAQLGLDEIFMGLNLYYQSVKYDQKMLGSKRKQFEIENAILEFVQYALVLKRNTDLQFKFTSNDALQNEFNQYELPHPILGKKGLSVPLDGVYKLTFDTVSKYVQLLTRKNLIELYQCQYADFKTTASKTPILEWNQEYIRIRKNDYKKGVEEHYFLDSSIKTLTADKPLKRNSIKSDVKMFEFYGIPKNIELPPHILDLEKAFLLLKRFSTFKGPQERTINVENRTYIVNNKGDKVFGQLFGTNESITLFEYEHLKKGIADYFGWPEMEIEFLLEFLSYDFSEDDTPYLWIQRPFLKIDDKIIWLGSFLKDRRWSYILSNRIKKEFKDTIGKTIATNLEKKVEKVFEEAGFNTTQGLKYPRKGPPKGDLDVVAYKDNYLFICEVKSGERSHDFSYVAQREMVKLGETAVHQLNKALRSKDLYWQELEKRLGLEVDLETVHIVPMIITDTFEGDGYFNATEIRKISLLELDVILKNKKRELLEMYQLTEMMANRREFPTKEDSEWDLWNGEGKLSCEKFLEVVDGGEVWGN